MIALTAPPHGQFESVHTMNLHRDILQTRMAATIQSLYPIVEQTKSLPATPASPIPPLNFPPCPTLQGLLTDRGLDITTSEKITVSFEKEVTNLRQQTERTASRAVISIASSWPSSLPSVGPSTRDLQLKMQHDCLVIYEKTIQNLIGKALAAADRIMAQRKVVDLPSKDGHAPEFNHEYTPFLLKYFEHNAFPSATDRKLIAQKSMMSPRQIEVWFQNRRRRARLEGKALQRRHATDSVPHDLSLEFVDEEMQTFKVQEEEHKAVIPEKIAPLDSDEISTYKSVDGPRHRRVPSAPDILDPVAPPHAFPTIFPPTCPYDPFPCKTGKFKFSPPVWMRTPAKSVPKRTRTDLDEFCDDFQKLTVRDVGRPTTAASQSASPSHPLRLAATYAYTTVPESAPLRSLIRYLPSVRKRVSSSSSSRSRSATPEQLASIPIAPTPQPPTPQPRRKVAGLPRRTPKSTQPRHSPVSHSSSSPSRSPSPTSRVPSLESDRSSSLHRQASHSSLGTPSPPSTPVMSPMYLRDQTPSVAGVDDMQSLFGDTPSIRSVSPVDGLSLPSSESYVDLTGRKQSFFNFGFSSPDVTSYAHNPS